MKNRSTVMVALILLAGCATTRSLLVSYPPQIADMCVRAMAESRAKIEACGTPLTLKADQVVALHRCKHRTTDGRWYWHNGTEDVYAQWTGYRIEIACGPEGEGVDYGALLHECAHYWLWTNVGDTGHSKQYDTAFNWSWIDERK